MIEEPFKGCIIKTYKPVKFNHYGYDITLQIIPGWEYMCEFNAESKEGNWLGYVISNLDNGHVTKKKQREQFNELLSYIKDLYNKKPKYEQLTIWELLQ